MAEIRNYITKEELVKYLKSLGIDVRLNTKARGHSGFCTGRRIDISKDLTDEKAVEVLLHEFAHYVHFKIEPEITKTRGSLQKLFNTHDISEIENELFQITLIVFDNTPIRRMLAIKETLNSKIKTEREFIKSDYPEFQTTKKFRDFEKFIKYSHARYLLKYDRVLIKGGWFRQDRLLSVKTLSQDFPTMPKAFAAYIKMKSFERRRNRLNARISKINRYLKQPTELFARFFELFCTDNEAVKNLAPQAYRRFMELKNSGYYPFLSDYPFNLPKNEQEFAM